MKNSSLGLLLYGLIALIMITFLTTVVMSVLITRETRNDEVIVDLTNRQRLLSQKYAKEFFENFDLKLLEMYQAAIQPPEEEDASSSDASEDISLEGLMGGGDGTPAAEEDNELGERQKTRQLFETTQAALMKGGKTWLDLDRTREITLSANNNEDFKGQLKRINSNWTTLMGLMDKTESDLAAGTLPTREALVELDRESNKNIKIIDDAVLTFQEAAEGRLSTLRFVEMAAVALVVLFGVMAIFLMRSRVMAPIGEAMELAQKVAEGDLTRRIPVQRRDEVGRLNEGLNKMCDDLGGIVTSLREEAQVLDQTSVVLNDSVGLAAHVTRQTRDQSSAVTGKSHELVDNNKKMSDWVSAIDNDAQNISKSSNEVANDLNQVDIAIEKISGNANDLASAVEEISHTLREITDRTQNTQKLTKNATSQAEKSSQLIDQLGHSAEQVGDVVNLIKGVAAQTNLLALNATIEAASAGEAGKGFAVVANEVKELARQTERATGDIQVQVATIQMNTQKAVEATAGIVQVVEELRADFEFMASAVSEQNIAINQISDSLTENADTTTQLNQSIHNSADSLNEINESLQLLAGRTGELLDTASQNTTSVHGIAEGLSVIESGVKENSEAAGETEESSVKVKHCSESLRGALERFVVETA